uniref:hypothetical protein n=1 Tax=Micromonospora carbonacea TaxID=47853 RepID=UPI003B22301B
MTPGPVRQLVNELEHYKPMRDDKLKPWTRSEALANLRTDAGAALEAAAIPADEQILAWALEEDTDAPDGY